MNTFQQGFGARLRVVRFHYGNDTPEAAAFVKRKGLSGLSDLKAQRAELGGPRWVGLW